MHLPIGSTLRWPRSLRAAVLRLLPRPAPPSEWLKTSPAAGVDGWLFPSETLKSPLSKDNAWRRYIAPKLVTVGLGWVNFQVMRRTHASLMRDLDVDPKIVADQQGHTLDVNLNVYTQTSMESRMNAVTQLESALIH